MAAIEMVTEEVATNLEEIAQVTRGVSGRNVGLVLTGIVVGTAVGFYFGYRYNREKIRAEVFAESEVEIEKIREVYQAKTVAAKPKPTVEEVIEEKGYSTFVPPPSGRVLRPPVPVRDYAREVPIIAVDPDIVADEEWDYAAELQMRVLNPQAPYVIHQNEFMNSETEYSKVTYTYYSGDDVLVGEDERPIPHGDAVVGQGNLKFGHGTDDENVVYVRNDQLRLEMEICRTNSSFEEEVLGLEHDLDADHDETS